MSKRTAAVLALTAAATLGAGSPGTEAELVNLFPGPVRIELDPGLQGDPCAPHLQFQKLARAQKAPWQPRSAADLPRLGLNLKERVTLELSFDFSRLGSDLVEAVYQVPFSAVVAKGTEDEQREGFVYTAAWSAHGEDKGFCFRGMVQPAGEAKEEAKGESKLAGAGAGAGAQTRVYEFRWTSSDAGR